MPKTTSTLFVALGSLVALSLNVIPAQASITYTNPYYQITVPDNVNLPSAGCTNIDVKVVWTGAIPDILQSMGLVVAIYDGDDQILGVSRIGPPVSTVGATQVQVCREARPNPFNSSLTLNGAKEDVAYVHALTMSNYIPTTNAFTFLTENTPTIRSVKALPGMRIDVRWERPVHGNARRYMLFYSFRETTDSGDMTGIKSSYRTPGTRYVGEVDRWNSNIRAVRPGDRIWVMVENMTCENAALTIAESDGCMSAPVKVRIKR